MYFKRIEMHGFKSFAEPVVIDFHQGVTCIVGPNGSGKSNISDAIRWVLGEQSPKMLRGGKMEEVIFNGTAQRKSRGMAEVTLVIDNTNGILPIDYNEVAITRRMYRSGESEYLINNNQCRLKDIRELIMDTGIGVDGYSIIGQGKIQSIIDGKADQRREIFEESAGVVMYKTKKQEAERKLASAQINLDRVNDIISEIEERIDSLKDDSINAREALELRARKRDLDINITLKNIEKFTDSNDSGLDDVKQLTDDINQLEVDRNTTSLKLDEARERNENLQTLGNDARTKLLVKVNEINEISSRYQLDEEKKSGFDRDIARIEGEIEGLSDKLEKEIQKSDRQEEEREAIERKNENLNVALTEKIKAYNDISARAFEVQNEIDEKKEKILRLSNEVSGLKSEAKSVESLKDTLSRRKEQIIRDSEELVNNAKAISDERRKVEDEKKANDKAGIKAMDELQKLEEIQKKLTESIRDMGRDCEDLIVRLSQARSRKKTFEEMEANYEGYNGAVKFIMKSGLKGIRGVVAELMEVPKEYSVAIETALGQNIQNIICQKDNDAKYAINLLKEQRAGRLTFLPMESVYGNTVNVDKAISGARGFEGLASDLIGFDEEYTGIFEYLLGRVAIVDNMDTAVRLSKNVGTGMRFVTIEGEVINASGAITGGKYKNQSADLLSRKNEIAELDKKIYEITGLSQKKAKEKSDLELKLQETSGNIASKQDEIRSLQLKDVALQSRLESLDETARNAEDANEKRDIELNNVDREFEEARVRAEASLIKAGELQKAIETLNEDIAAGSQLMSELAQRKQDASSEITRARVDRTEAEKELEHLEELMNMTQDAIDEYTEMIDDKTEELDKLQERLEKLMFGSDDSEEKFTELANSKKELEDYIVNVDKERDLVLKSIQSLTQELNTVTERYNRLQDQKQQQQIRMARNEAQLETAKQKLLEDFEITYAQALEFKKEDFVYSTAVKESREIRNRLDELGDINVGAIEEYQKVSERYGFLTEQRADITSAMDELRSIINDMDRTIRTRFKKNFDEIVTNFEEIFKELFGGGTCELRLDNEDNPLESGIDIIAQPPGKKLQNINLLSGGEKSMTAIALMFAVLKTKPTPFCILDEVEAALDDANIDRFANYLRKFNEIQFAVVTHQKVTMEHADVLYGVTMPEQGISKVLSLKLGDEFEI